MYELTRKRVAPELGEPTSEYEVRAAVHPFYGSRKVAVICPGLHGTMDGYEGKYVAIAQSLQRRGFNVVRMENVPPEQLTRERYPEFALGNLRAILEFVTTVRTGVDPAPRVMMMGTSAGGSAIAAAAVEFPEVEKILLVNPSSNVGLDAMKESMTRFTGDVAVLLGGADDVVDNEIGITMHALAMNAASRKIEVVQDADHQFRGDAHGKIFAQAPLWAFLNEPLEPSGPVLT
jgi:dienelactone hydrolase